MKWCLAVAGIQILSAGIAMQVLLVDMKEETEKPNEDLKNEKETTEYEEERKRAKPV